MTVAELTREETTADTRPILAVSADSHITEPPNMYVDFIDPAYRERAPYVAVDPQMGGEAFYVEGFARPIALGLLAAAGKDPRDIKVTDEKFSDLHLSGWDPKYRLADQDRDGVQAEFIYPTVNMLVCNHPDGIDALIEIVRAFDSANLELSSLVLHEPTLDDVFLAKTGRSLEGAGSEEASGEMSLPQVAQPQAAAQ